MRYIKEYNEYQPNEDTVKRWCDYLDNNYPIKQDSDRFIVIDDKSYFLTGILFNKGRLVNKIFSDIFYSDKMSGSKIDKPSLRRAIKNWIDINSEERVMESKLDRPNYKKLDIDGFIVYQGKDAKSNDYVTFELSDDEDYWFHAHNFAGSHLLLKIKDKLPQNETIKKVAELAAKNSKAPNGDVVVVWSKKKFIKKERAMNPGQVKVDYINSNKITIRK